MAVFQFKPKKMIDSIENGSYTGTIDNITFSSDVKYCWFTIKVDGIDEYYFNTMFTTIDSVFNCFACKYVTDEGYFCSDDLINAKIEFDVETKHYNNKSVSKVTSIRVIDKQ